MVTSAESASYLALTQLASNLQALHLLLDSSEALQYKCLICIFSDSEGKIKQINETKLTKKKNAKTSL